ncbi:unnamed protein product [Microthlaspi erraticum]|uniref:Uncharacterized protein n=1 Tax=Microthlaspi erraticum TaxID=1685480 RepID=A0A6D2J5I7_9BRAS|nr:unnamed protein product [Microthlaspi erraticum]
MRMYHRGEIPPMDGDRSQGKSFPPRPPKSGQQEKRGRQPRPRKDAEKRKPAWEKESLLDNDDSISAIKEYERKAVAAQRYPYIHKGIPTSPLRIRTQADGHPSPRPTRNHSTDSRL